MINYGLRAELIDKNQWKNEQLFEDIDAPATFPWLFTKPNKEYLLENDNVYDPESPTLKEVLLTDITDLRNAFVGDYWYNKGLHLAQQSTKTNTGLILGDRGTGKTFLARKMADYIDNVKLTALDKRNMKRKTFINSNNPDIEFYDDLHLETDLMNIELSGMNTRTPEEILEDIITKREEASECGSKFVMISSEDAGEIAMKFPEEYRKTFLEQMHDCIATPDGQGIYLKYTGKINDTKQGVNILDLRYRINDKLANNIRKRFNIPDLPVRMADTGMDGIIGLKNRTTGVNHSKRIIEPIMYHIYPRNNKGEYYDSIETKVRSIHENYKIEDWDRVVSKPIARIRELATIENELGQISRETFDIPFGKYNEKSASWEYNHGEALQIESFLKYVYDDLTQSDRYNLATSFLNATTDEDAKRILMEARLSEE